MNRNGFLLRVRGFTLVELTISLAIIMVLTTILLWRYPETSIRLTLANMTHTVALLVREAQLRGSAIDSVNSSLGGYGVYLERSNPARLVLFGDTVDAAMDMPYGIPVGNGLYEASAPLSETKTTTDLSAGYVVEKLCIGQGFPFTCGSVSGTTINSLTISFTRPMPQPSMYINGSKSVNYAAACIELRSPRAPLSGHIRSVQVFSSGIIRTDNAKCDTSPS